MPLQGVEEWDRPGDIAHDPEALAEMIDEVRSAMRVPVVEIDAHINDQAFSDAVLQQLDAWVADGTVNMG